MGFAGLVEARQVSKAKIYGRAGGCQADIISCVHNDSLMAFIIIL